MCPLCILDKEWLDVGDSCLWQVEDKHPFEGLCWNGSSLLEWTLSFDLDRCQESENEYVTVTALYQNYKLFMY